MSHMAAIDLEITDLDALEAACKHLKLELVRGQTTWKWFGRWVNDFHAKEAAYNFGIGPKEYGKCAEHAIRMVDDANANAYEIGVVRRRDGKPGYILLFDFFAQGDKITKLIQGTNEKGEFDRAGKLKQYYTACKSEQQLKAKGYDCRIVVKDNQHVQCVARRMRSHG